MPVTPEVAGSSPVARAETPCKSVSFVVTLGVNDRRLFACPALIPLGSGNALFAGSFVLPMPRCAGWIPRQILSEGTIAHFCSSAAGAGRSTHPLVGTVLENLAARFLEQRRVCDKAAGRNQLGELASLGPANRDRRPGAQTPLESACGSTTSRDRRENGGSLRSLCISADEPVVLHSSMSFALASSAFATLQLTPIPSLGALWFCSDCPDRISGAASI